MDGKNGLHPLLPLSLSLPERSIVIRLPIDVGRKGKEVSGWVMDQDDWSTAGWPTFQMAHTTTAASLTNIPGAVGGGTKLFRFA